MKSTTPIPRPKGDPLIGNLRSIDGDAPVQGLMRQARIMGPIYQLEFFGKLLTMVSSQELVNELCDETRFDKRVHATLKNIRDFAGDGLFTARTEEPNWGPAHRILMPAFGPLGMRGMFDQMLDIAEQMLLRWERFGPDSVIEVTEDMTRLTLDTIALCAFDYRFNSFYQHEMHPFVGAMVDALAEAGARERRPEIASKLMLGTRRRYEDDLKLMREVAESLIAERRRDPAAAAKKDLLGLMLQGRDPVTGEGLPDENIRYQMVTFLIAGHETTSGLLSFVMYFLCKNPQVLNKARALVDEVLGDELPRVEDLGRLRYIEQILMESLRIWPTAPAFALKPLQDTVLGGKYAITKRDTLMVITPTLHRDTSVWGDDVEEFRPERFDPGLMEKLPPNAWKPFGNGQRACIGRPFAMQEAMLLVAMILQRFDLIEHDPAYQLKVKETLTLKPEGFHIRVKRRGSGAVRARSAVPREAAKPAPAAPAVALAPGEQATPLLVLYGSNTGSSEAFAQRIASDARGQGYAAQAAPLDDHTGALPAEGAVVIVTASYEGQPPDNAKQFTSWAEALAPGALAGVHYAVFGCGNRQWARTWQAVPKRLDDALQKAGAARALERGETDSGGDFFGAFDDWYAGLWPALGKALGKQVQQAAPAGAQLRVERVQAGRSAILRLGELAYGEVVENRELVDMTSPLGRSKRHIDIRLPAGMSYRAGDYLSVLAHNPPGLVMRALKRFNLAADSQIVIRKPESSLTSLPVDHPVAVSEVLFHYVELAQPATRAQVGQLAAATRCPPEQAELSALADDAAYQRDVLAKRVSVLELLERYASCELDLAAFLEMLPPTRARQYSISSSPLRDAERCSLTVAVVDAPALSGQGRYQGMASSFLAGCTPGTRLAVAVRGSNDHFHPPASPETPIIMVCAGTGLAPFHGFVQERAIQAANGRSVGPALLFFGCDHPDVDYLYRDELQAWEKAGVVSIRPAFFKAPQGEVTFVQHRLWQDRADVAELFRRGAHVYVCGDGKRMAPAVRDTFLRIYQEAVGVTREQAEAWADKIERETGRYVSDVFA